MPYKLKGNCVVKKDTGETLKCYDNEQEAKDYLAALYANVEKGVSMTDTFSYFVPLTKVVELDDGSCLVYTRGVQEEVDRSNEIFDYESSVPLLKQWSDEAFKRSQGKSYGNVRAMHGKQAAGKLNEPMAYSPDERAIDLVVKVVDPTDAKKCREGVYTGMSIGGHYAKRWQDPKNPRATRYTADPIEFSLVDMPNVRSATFDLVKLGGEVELKKFSEDADSETPVNEEVAQVAGSEGYAPSAESIVVEAKNSEYIVKTGVDTVIKAPDPMSHGIEKQAVDIITVPDWAKPLIAAVEKLTIAKGDSDELLKSAGDQVGIVRREGEPKLPPVGYPTDLSEYGDPANWGWRYDTGEFAKASVAQYNLRKNRNRYNDREWNILGRRLSYRASSLLGEKYLYDPVNQEIKMPELTKGGFEDVMKHIKKAAHAGIENASDPQKVIDILHQIAAACDISADAQSAPIQQPVGESLAMAAEPEKKKEGTTTPKEKETEMEKAIQLLTTQVSNLTKIVEGIVKVAQPLRKNAPLGDLNTLPIGETDTNMTALQKSILAAAGQVREGIQGSSIRAVMDAAGGDGEEAKTAALDLVKASLAARGFSSASKIRTISPGIAAQIRQSITQGEK